MRRTSTGPLRRIRPSLRSITASLAMSAAVILPFAAHAQEATDEAAETRPMIDDIIVTAQRVEQRLQDVPVAVTSISGSDLSAAGVDSLVDMTAQVPSLTVNRNLGIVNLYIRGIGNSFLNLGGDSSVALHQDGVYIGRPRAQVTAFIDVDRIEVLRGPQGTLYGRNATGGSINIMTRKPSNQWAANADLSVGNYSLVRLDAGVGGPLAEGLAFRAAITGTRRDGFGENIQTGTDIDNLREFGGRLSTRWDVSPDFDILLTADYYRAKDNANSFHYLGQGRPDRIPLGVIRGGRVPFDTRDISSERDPSRYAKVYGFAGFATWNVAEGLTLKSTTAYRKSTTELSSDADGTEIPLLRIDHSEVAKQLSQEFQATYTSDAMTAVAGLYYFNEKIDGATLVRLLFLNPNAFSGSGPAEGEVDAYAAYGQVAINLTDRLTLTGALRYSYERRDTVGSAGGVALPYREKSWDSVTPRAVIDYELADDVMAYASVSKGFKSGTYLIGNPNPVVNPETLWAYEAGLKSQLFDRRVQLNLAAFYYDYSDLQVSRVVANTTIVENAASATLKGAEAELIVVPWKGGQINASATYLDSKFKSFATSDAAHPELGLINLAGNRLPFAPKWAATVRGEQSFDTGDGELTFGLDLSYLSRTYHDAFNLSSRGQASYALVNGRISYAFPGDRFSISGWVRNLTDKKVKTSVVTGAFAVNVPLVGSLNEPLTTGFTLSYKM